MLLDAYAAGLIDGEGCLGIYNSHPNKRWFHIQLKVALVQPDEQVLYDLQDRWGGSVYRIISRDIKHQPQTVWCLTDHQALNTCLDELKPFLRIKQDQAGVLQYYIQNLVGKAGRVLSDETIKKRRVCYEATRFLNQRGSIE